MTATNRRRSSTSSSSPGKKARRPAEIAAAARPVADRLAAAHDLVLWGVTFLRDAGRETLRVALDRRGGIGAEDLASFAEELSRELDRFDVVPGESRYTLEVTSPGAERKLEDPEQFEVCVGRVAKVLLKDGRTIEGAIAGVTDRAVDIDADGVSVRALFEDIAKAQLVVKF